MKIKIQTINAQGRAEQFELITDGKSAVQFPSMPYQKFAIEIDGKAMTAAVAMFKKNGQHLVVEVEGQAVLEVENFYEHGQAELIGADWTFTPAQPSVADAVASTVPADTAHGVSAATDPLQTVTVGPDAVVDGAGVSSGMLVALFGGGAIVGGLALGGGSTAATAGATVAPITSPASGSYSVKIGVVAGPITDKLSLQITKVNGEILQYSTDAQGNVVVTISDGYIGAVLIKATSNNNGAKDFIDEATGVGKNFDSPLRAVIWLDGKNDISITVTPLTELAVRLAIDPKGGVLPSTLAAVLLINKTVGDAFGVDLAGSVVAVIAATGSANSAYNEADGISAAETYGRVLAALSAVDKANAGSMDTTLSNLSKAAAVSNRGFIDAVSSTLAQGAVVYESGATKAMASLLTSTATLGAPSSANIASVAQSANSAILAAGVSAADITAGIQVPVAVVAGAVAGDVVTLVVKNAAGVVEQTVSHVLTAAEAAAGVANVTLDKAALASVTDGAKTIQSTITNGSHALASNTTTVVIDNTPPSSPSASNVAAAAVVASSVPSTLGAADAANGVTLPIALPANSVPGDSVVLTIPAGVNGVAQTVTHVVTASDISTGYAAVVVTSAQLAAAGDGNKVITAVAHDAVGNVSLTPIAVATIVLNIAKPVLGSADLSMPENSTAAVALTAVDALAVSWSLTPGGADNDLFTLSASGALSLKVAADFETPNSAGSSNAYSVSVRATDAAGNYTNHTYLVNVTNVNEAPARIGALGAVFGIANQVFTLAASVVAAAFHDPDAGTVLTYSATGLPAGLTIDSSSGAISGTVTSSVSTHIVITASDGSLTGSQGFDFSAILNTSNATLTAPSAAATSAAALQLAAGSLAGGVNAQEAAAGIVLPIPVATGAVVGDLLQVSLTGSVLEKTLYYVLTSADITSGVVSLPVTASQLLVLTDGEKSIVATFSNASNNFVEPALTLLIDQTPPNAPSTAHLAAAAQALASYLPSNLIVNAAEAAAGILLAVALPANSVAGDTVSLTIPAGSGGAVQIISHLVGVTDLTAGFVSVEVSSAQLAAAADGLKVISASVHDAIGNVGLLPIAVASFTLATVAPVVGTSNFSMPENSTGAVNLTATDSLAVTWSLVAGGADNALFALSASGALSLKAAANFEMPGSAALTNAYSVTVRATDLGGNFTDHTYTVNLTNVNEAPLPVGTLAPASSVVGQPFSLAAGAIFHDPDAGAVLTFTATGLPSGLSINSATGALTGSASAAGVSHITITASDGSLTSSQSFDFTSVGNTSTSTAVLATPSATNAAAVAALVNSTLSGALNGAEVSAGFVVPIAIAGGAVAGDVVQIVIAGTTGVPEQTIPYILTAADVLTGVAKVMLTPVQLSALTDGAKTIQATFINGANQITTPAISIVIDQTPPSVPSAINVAAAATEVALVLPSTALGVAEVAHGVTLPVALPANSIAGDTITLTLPAGMNGVAQTITYVVQAADVAAGYAAIAVTSSQLTASGDGAKAITATVHDSAGNLSPTPIAVVSLTVNTKPPAFGASTFSIPENSTAVATLTADTTAVSFSLVAGGADNALFTVSASGALNLKVAPDFEKPASSAMSNTYMVKVRAADASGNVTDQLVTVNVTNVIEAPLAFGTLSPAVAFVNKPFMLDGGVIASVFQPEAGSTLVYSASGMPAGLSIDSSTGTISGTPTAVVTASIIVTATAGPGLTATQSFTFTSSINTSTAPLSGATASNTANANAAVTAAFSSPVNATEIASGIMVPVAIAGGALAGDVVQVTIQASNGVPEKTVSYVLTATDIATGVAQVPFSAAQLSSLTDGAKSIVATFSNGGASSVSAPLINLTIDQTPPNVPSTANNTAAAVAIAADLPANLALDASVASHGVTIPVALPADSVVGDTITLTIPAAVNGTLQTITHVVTALDVTAGFAAIAITGTQLTNAGDGVKAITASVHDAAGNASTTPIAVVTITLDTAAPVLATGNFSIPENATPAMNLSAVDSVPVTWSFVSTGADNALFTLSANGLLRLKVAADFEAPGSAAGSNAYSVTVRATDAAGNTADHIYTINVTNVNEAPAPIGALAAEVAVVGQNFLLSSSVVAALFHDPDAGAVLSYSATGLPPGLTINNATGAISGIVTSALTTQITISASDGTVSGSQSFAFSAIGSSSTAALATPAAASTTAAAAIIAASPLVGGINAAEVASGFVVPIAIAGGAVAGDVVQIVIAGTNGLPETTISYVLSAGDISSGMAQITFTPAEVATLTDGAKTIQATFINGANQITTPVTSIVIDQTAPSAPSVINVAAAAAEVALVLPSTALGVAEVAHGVTLPVALPANSVAGDTITLTLPAGVNGVAQTISYVVQAADVAAGYAAIAVTSSQLTASGDGAKAITATVHDSAGNLSPTPIAVVSLTVNAKPPSFGASTFSIPENSTAVATLTASDTTGVSFSLVAGGADNALFTVSASGALSLKVAPDFEKPASSTMSNTYMVKVRAADPSGNVTDQLVTVNVTNVIEAPVAFGTLSPAVAFVNKPFTLDGGVIASVFHPEAGSTLVYSASGLPVGLSINSSTGTISGTPTAVVTASIIVTATAGPGLTATQSFTFTSSINTSTAPLSSANVSNTTTAANDANAAFGTSVSATELAAGIMVPVAIAGGALVGDVVQVTIQASSGVPEKTVSYVLTAADITNGVAQVPFSAAQLSSLTDGAKSIVATFSNGGTSSVSAPLINLTIDQTPPSVPSTSNNTAAAVAISTDLPANLTLGTTDVQNGVVVPVALPANSVPGDTVTVTIPAGMSGTAQTISHVVTALDVAAGFVSVAVTSAQLTSAGDGVKAITASVHDAAGNASVTPIAVATITLDTAAPVLDTGNFSIPENATPAMNLSAVDSVPVTWSFVSTGADNALFTLSANGLLRLKVAADFETPNSAAGSNAYSVTVRATDAAGNFSDHTYTVNLSNVNEAPVPVGLLSSAVTLVNQSFSLAGSVVAAAFHDLDAGDSLTYSASGLPSGLTINASTGAISGTVTAAINAHILVTATDSGGLTGTQSFDFSALLNSSNVTLSAPTGANATAAGALLLAGSLAGGVNAAEAALGIVIPVAVASGAAAGDLVQVTIANGASVVEQAMSQVLTAADITAGVVKVPVTAAQLAVVSDGSKALQATFLNSSSQFAEAVFTLVLDQTPPNAPSNEHLAAAQTALAQDLPASLVLGTSQVASGVTLPVALPANSVAGDVITLTIPAGASGSVQSLSYSVLAADVTAGFAAVAVSSAQLHGAGDGLKAITALVHDAIGNVSALPIAVVSLSINTVAPIFTGNSFTMLENSVTPVTLTATDLTAISWTLSGTANDNNLFTLGSGGALSLKAPANFEAPGSALHTNAYSVLVRATDVAGNYNEQTVTVNLLNVNEAPVAVGTLANVSTTVNQAFTLAASTVANAFADPDAGTVLSYSMSGQPPGFSINASTGAVTGTATTFSSTPFHIVISASDGSLTTTQSFDLSTISVPTFSQIAHPLASTEKGGNSISFTVTVTEVVNIIGLPTLSMKMNGQVVTAQYSSGSGSASLIFTTTVPNSGDGSLIVVDSINLPSGASVTGATSGLALSSSVSGLGVSNVVIDNTPPVVTTTNLSLPENSVAALSLLATDVSAVTWALVSGSGVDNGLFNLSSSGALTLKAAANFEQTGSATGTNAYTVSVSATDAVGHITNQLVTVNITNVNEAPNALGTLADVSAGVNQVFTVAASVVAAAFSDPDAGTVWHYSISGQPSGVSINPTTGAITGVVNAATTTPYYVTVTGSDGVLSATQSFDLSAHPVPTILSISHGTAIDAGGTIVDFTVTLNEMVTVAVSDQRPTLMLNMNGVLVSALYQSGSGTANLTFEAQLPNTGDGSSIFVSAINLPTGATITGNTTGLPLATNILGQALATITIDNTPPVFGNAVFALPENSVAALTLTATDLTTLHWTLAPASSSNDNALFVLSSTGALNFVSAPDFEMPNAFSGANAYSVLVDVKDAVNHVTEHMVTVNVTNVNEAPTPHGTLANVTTALNIAYDLSASTVAGAFIDPDVPTTWSYSATGLPHGLSINSSTGEISGTPDVGTTSAAHVVVTASDGQLTAQQPFDMSVTAPMHLSSTLSGVSNLDVQSNLVLSSSDTVASAVAGKFIHLVEDSGSGNDDSNIPTGAPLHNQDISVTDTSLVNIINGRIVINPTFDLDFAGNYHIAVDAGAFLGAGGEPSAAISDPLALHFSSVALGSSNGMASLANAAASQIMANDGTLSASYKWLSMAGMGNAQAPLVNQVDMGTSKIALVFRNEETQVATPDYCAIAVGEHGFSFHVTNFNTNDMVYVDDQNNPAVYPEDLPSLVILYGNNVPSYFAIDKIDGVIFPAKLFIDTFIAASNGTVVTTADHDSGPLSYDSLAVFNTLVKGASYTGNPTFILG